MKIHKIHKKYKGNIHNGNWIEIATKSAIPSFVGLVSSNQSRLIVKTKTSVPSVHQRPPPIFLSARTNLLQVRFIVNCLGAHQLPVIRHPLQPYPGCTSEVWLRWKEGLLSRSYLRSGRAIFLTGPLAPSPWPHRSRPDKTVRCSRGPPGGHTACPLCSVSCASSMVPQVLTDRPAAPTTFSACPRDADCSRAITRSLGLISNFFSLLSFQRNSLLAGFLCNGVRSFNSVPPISFQHFFPF